MQKAIGETLCMHQSVILQRNAVDGPKQMLQLDRDEEALVSYRTLENRSLIQRKEQSPGVERHPANQVLAASEDCHPLMPAKK